jgi:hypothetical protein
VLVNAFSDQYGDVTVTVCLNPSGRRVLVATIKGEELCGRTGCETTPAVTLPRSSGRWSAFVINFFSLNDIIVVIDTHSGRFQRVDSGTCGGCVGIAAPAIPSLAVGPSGALAWVIDERGNSGGFDLLLHATRRTRPIDRRARSISHLRVGKTAVTWRDAGRPRRLGLS